jgi:predicted MFS family arabinose efflux permease
MRPTAAVRPTPSILPYAWVILAVVYFASVAAPLNQFKVPPIMPVLMSTFQISLTQAGSLMSVLAMVGLVLALPAGIILQRLGAKTTVLIALGFMAGGAAVGALAGNYLVLMTGRVLEAAGIGLIGVAAPAIIASWFPPEKQGGPMGIWATWVPVGSVLMYNLAPAIAANWGWQAVWWGSAAFAGVMIVLSGLLLRQPPAAAGEAHSRPAKLELGKALANRDIWLLAGMFACFNLTLVSLATFYPTYLNEVRGLPLSQASFLASLGSLVVIFSAPVGGLLSDRTGSRRLFFSVPFLLVAVFFLFPFKVTGGQIAVMMVIQGLVIGSIPTATFAAATELMRRPEWAGLGLAAVLIGQNVGNLVGPVLFGWLVGSAGWAAAGYWMIPISLLGFLFGWLVRIR